MTAKKKTPKRRKSGPKGAVDAAKGINGFIASARRHASGETSHGRHACTDVQWTGAGPDRFVTFTITAEDLAAAADSRLLWTDQDVQRGILPGLPTSPPKELALADGYPDGRLYVFNSENADDMVDKLLRGDQLFLSPLVWNLRPGTFQAYWESPSRRIYIYDGKVYLPDSHHRHQAILKAVNTWKEAPGDYPAFSGDHQFKVELYFLDRDGEGDYFFDKNQLPTRTEKSKAYDLTTRDHLSLLAKRFVALTPALAANVNRVTDRLTAKNPQVVTLSTLREMMRTFAPEDTLEPTELEGLATVAAKFYELLVAVRPELGQLEMTRRKHVRKTLIVDAATIMHGYAALMADFAASVANEGMKRAEQTWRDRLARLSSDRRYSVGGWSGDIFDKTNPVWQSLGITKPGKHGRELTVLNTGAARLKSGKALRQLVSTDSPPPDLALLIP